MHHAIEVKASRRSAYSVMSALFVITVSITGRTEYPIGGLKLVSGHHASHQQKHSAEPSASAPLGGARGCLPETKRTGPGALLDSLSRTAPAPSSGAQGAARRAGPTSVGTSNEEPSLPHCEGRCRGPSVEPRQTPSSASSLSAQGTTEWRTLCQYPCRSRAKGYQRLVERKGGGEC